MFLTFLLSPLGRRLAGAAAVLALIAGFAWHFYAKGREAGAQDQQASDLTQSKKAFDQLEAGYQDRLQRSAADAEQARAAAAAYQQQASLLAVKAIDAVRAAAADRGKIEQLPDAAVPGDLEVRLGGKLSQPEILRKLDLIVADYPHVLEENRALAGQVAALTAGAAEQTKQIAATESSRDAAIDAYNALLPLYVQAYNAAQPRKRKFWCLFLCKRAKKIALPPPVTFPRLAH